MVPATIICMDIKSRPDFPPARWLVLAAGTSLLTCPAAAREIRSFDDNWRFARFGLMADGTRTAEPGTESPLIRITDIQLSRRDPGQLVHLQGAVAAQPQ